MMKLGLIVGKTVSFTFQTDFLNSQIEKKKIFLIFLMGIFGMNRLCMFQVPTGRCGKWKLTQTEESLKGSS